MGKRAKADDKSDSEMSLLIDSTPPAKNATRKECSGHPKPLKSKSTTKPKSIDKSTTSTTEEEIKYLKSLVYKCGVRKNWWLYPNYI